MVQEKVSALFTVVIFEVLTTKGCSMIPNMGINKILWGCNDNIIH